MAPAVRREPRQLLNALAKYHPHVRALLALTMNTDRLAEPVARKAIRTISVLGRFAQKRVDFSGTLQRAKIRERIPVVFVVDDAAVPRPNHTDVALLIRYACRDPATGPLDLQNDQFRVGGLMDDRSSHVIERDQSCQGLQVLGDCRLTLEPWRAGRRKGKFHDDIVDRKSTRLNS